MKGVSVTELPLEARKNLESKAKLVPEKLVALARVLQVFDGMSKRDALWVLRKGIKELGGK